VSRALTTCFLYCSLCWRWRRTNVKILYIHLSCIFHAWYFRLISDITTIISEHTNDLEVGCRKQFLQSWMLGGPKGVVVKVMWPTLKLAPPPVSGMSEDRHFKFGMWVHSGKYWPTIDPLRGHVQDHVTYFQLSYDQRSAELIGWLGELSYVVVCKVLLKLFLLCMVSMILMKNDVWCVQGATNSLIVLKVVLFHLFVSVLNKMCTKRSTSLSE